MKRQPHRDNKHEASTHENKIHDIFAFIFIEIVRKTMNNYVYLLRKQSFTFEIILLKIPIILHFY